MFAAKVSVGLIHVRPLRHACRAEAFEQLLILRFVPEAGASLALALFGARVGFLEVLEELGDLGFVVGRRRRL